MTGMSFDLARKSSGYALWVDGEPTVVGTVSLPAGFLGEQLRAWVNAMNSVIPPRLDWVAHEDARAVSKQHGMILFGMTGLLHLKCWDAGIPVIGVNQKTAKKTLTGRGNALKPDMVIAAQARWPHLNVETDDQADALAVGLCFLATQG